MTSYMAWERKKHTLDGVKTSLCWIRDVFWPQHHLLDSSRVNTWRWSFRNTEPVVTVMSPFFFRFVFCYTVYRVTIKFSKAVCGLNLSRLTHEPMWRMLLQGLSQKGKSSCRSPFLIDYNYNNDFIIVMRTCGYCCRARSKKGGPARKGRDRRKKLSLQIGRIETWLHQNSTSNTNANSTTTTTTTPTTTTTTHGYAKSPRGTLETPAHVPPLQGRHQGRHQGQHQEPEQPHPHSSDGHNHDHDHDWAAFFPLLSLWDH